MQVEPPTYSLRLISPGDDRLRLMMAIRALRPDMGLKQAKALFDDLPQVIKHDVGYYDRDRLRRRFLNIGAVVEFIENIPGAQEH